jgi:hypothetical protein
MSDEAGEKKKKKKKMRNEDARAAGLINLY